jgi:hypothetical protein
MDEYFLHYLWQYQKFKHLPLHTVEGESISVIKVGFHNHNSGPDFLEAKVKINDIEWSGSVEIHFKSSDWIQHKHDKDEAYANVILHVVWTHDQEILHRDSQAAISTLEISKFVDHNLTESYRSYINQPQAILCASKLNNLPSIKTMMMLDHAATERLESKADVVLTIFRETGEDWEETAYRLLGKNFGFSVNKEAFATLTQSLPFKVIQKHIDHPKQVFALIFGQAGFLEKESDEYTFGLKQEFDFLRYKYQLRSSLSRVEWKFSKLRPANFPTVRLAQFATLITQQRGLFGFFTQEQDLKHIIAKLSVKPTGYWAKHYDFGKKLESGNQNLGRSSIENILINTVAPLLTAYAKTIDETKYIQQAIDMLSQLKPEQNRITKQWATNGIRPESAYQSQALLQQYNEYCVKKKCLHCNIGISILHR